jgi:hypothetical protein
VREAEEAERMRQELGDLRQRVTALEQEVARLRGQV